MKIQPVVLDTETTASQEGVYLEIDDIVEVTIVPIKEDFTRDESIPIFSTLVNPEGGYNPNLRVNRTITSNRNEALPFNNILISDILEKGISSKEFKSYLRGWMEALGIEQFIPLAHNWSFDRAFLGKLIGSKEGDALFNRRARDSHSLAVSINDRYALCGMEKPFESTSLGFLANFFGFDTSGAHRAEKDCEMTLAVYKKLLTFKVPQLTE